MAMCALLYIQTMDGRTLREEDGGDVEIRPQEWENAPCRDETF